MPVKTAIGSTPTTYGYARVSTRDQNLDRQLDAIREFDVTGRQIYRDKASGKDFDQPAWKRLMARLKAGNLLVVKSINRLGRDYDDIITHWRHITKEVHADIVVLDMPLLDTRGPEKGVTGTFIADLAL
jgi:DNA invertase Pin-like site-specific DNA recombinase